MLRIDDIIFSLDILEEKFACDLPKCLGSCCREGDAGAPLSDGEAEILQEIWPEVKPYLRPEGIKAIEEAGTSVKDFDLENVTPLIEGKECAYALINNGILSCAIEQAWSDGKIVFQKPLSCHLFPARVKKFTDFRAVNYSEQPVCASARKRGRKKEVYVYEFLKAPLIRAFGEKMYRELCVAAAELRKKKKR
jgi:hypothetical protein